MWAVAWGGGGWRHGGCWRRLLPSCSSKAQGSPSPAACSPARPCPPPQGARWRGSSRTGGGRCRRPRSAPPPPGASRPAPSPWPSPPTPRPSWPRWRPRCGTQQRRASSCAPVQTRIPWRPGRGTPSDETPSSPPGPRCAPLVLGAPLPGSAGQAAQAADDSERHMLGAAAAPRPAGLRPPGSRARWPAGAKRTLPERCLLCLPNPPAIPSQPPSLASLCAGRGV